MTELNYHRGSLLQTRTAHVGGALTLASQVTSALQPMDAAVYHLHSACGDTSTTVSRLLLGLPQPVPVANVSTVLDGIVKRVYEVINIQVQGVLARGEEWENDPTGEGGLTHVSPFWSKSSSTVSPPHTPIPGFLLPPRWALVNRPQDLQGFLPFVLLLAPFPPSPRTSRTQRLCQQNLYKVGFGKVHRCGLVSGRNSLSFSFFVGSVSGVSKHLGSVRQ